MSDTAVTTELLPCPLCRASAFMDGRWYVCCSNESCQCSTVQQDTEAAAIAAWNRRAPAQPETENAVPVAWMYQSSYHGRREFFPNSSLWKEGGYADRNPDAEPLYLRPATDRNAIIEECARVADQLRLTATPDHPLFGQGMSNAADQIATALRNLKEPS